MTNIHPDKNAIYSSLAAKQGSDFKTAYLLIEQGYYYDLNESSALLDNKPLINWIVEKGHDEFYKKICSGFNWQANEGHLIKLIKAWCKIEKNIYHDFKHEILMEALEKMPLDFIKKLQIDDFDLMSYIIKNSEKATNFKDLSSKLVEIGLNLSDSPFNLYAVLAKSSSGGKDVKEAKLDLLINQNLNPNEKFMLNNLTSENIWEFLQTNFFEKTQKLTHFASNEKVDEIKRSEIILNLSGGKLKSTEVVSELKAIEKNYGTVNIVNQKGNSLLFESITKFQTMVINKILKHNPDWLQQNSEKQFPLLKLSSDYLSRDKRPQASSWYQEIDRQISNQLNDKKFIEKIEDKLNDLLMNLETFPDGECKISPSLIKNIYHFPKYLNHIYTLSNSDMKNIEDLSNKILEKSIAIILYKNLKILFTIVKNSKTEPNDYGGTSFTMEDTNKIKKSIKEVVKYTPKDWDHHPLFYLPYYIAFSNAKEIGYGGYSNRKNTTVDTYLDHHHQEAVEVLINKNPFLKTLNWLEFYEKIKSELQEKHTGSIEKFVFKMDIKQPKLDKKILKL